MAAELGAAARLRRQLPGAAPLPQKRVRAAPQLLLAPSTWSLRYIIFFRGGIIGEHRYGSLLAVGYCTASAARTLLPAWKHE